MTLVCAHPATNIGKIAKTENFVRRNFILITPCIWKRFQQF